MDSSFGTAYARGTATEDYAVGLLPESSEAIIGLVEQLWGTEEMLRMTEPTLTDPKEIAFDARMQRLTCSRGTFVEQVRFADEFNARAILSAVRVPTLVLHNDNEFIPMGLGIYLADHIEGARLVRITGKSFTGMRENHEVMANEIEEFVTGTKPRAHFDRVLATVMFTDLVGSTEHAVKVGDQAWTGVLDQHDQIVQAAIEERGGRLVKSTGDGVLATFDGPGRAIQCSLDLRRSLDTLGLEIYCGLHTGEIELRDDDIGGIAVHIAARIMAVAKAGEIVCSRTVKDLVVGSGVEFDAEELIN